MNSVQSKTYNGEKTSLDQIIYLSIDSVGNVSVQGFYKTLFYTSIWWDVYGMWGLSWSPSLSFSFKLEMSQNVHVNVLYIMQNNHWKYQISST